MPYRKPRFLYFYDSKENKLNLKLVKEICMTNLKINVLKYFYIH